MTRAVQPAYIPRTPCERSVSRIMVSGDSRLGQRQTPAPCRVGEGMRHTFPPNCERVLTNSIGYVTNLYPFLDIQLKEIQGEGRLLLTPLRHLRSHPRRESEEASLSSKTL
jgi:hypothetical protein